MMSLYLLGQEKLRERKKTQVVSLSEYQINGALFIKCAQCSLPDDQLLTESGVKWISINWNRFSRLLCVWTLYVSMM